MSEVFETITDYTAAGSFKSIAENVKYLKSPDYAMLIRTTDLKSRFRKGDFIYVSKSAFDYLWRVKMDKECIVMPNVGNCGEIVSIRLRTTCIFDSKLKATCSSWPKLGQVDSTWFVLPTCLAGVPGELHGCSRSRVSGAGYPPSIHVD